MRRVLIGFICAFVACAGFSLLASVAICLGADPETRGISDFASPLLGILVGAWCAARGGSWRSGVHVAFVYIVLWFVLFMYVNARWNILGWFLEGLPRLTRNHFGLWTIALLTGAIGGLLAQKRASRLWIVIAVAVTAWMFSAAFTTRHIEQLQLVSEYPGYRIERPTLGDDGTIVDLITFDFWQSDFKVRVYDCDSDDAKPFDDSNTTYMGQGLSALLRKLDARKGEHVLFAVNGGFFGASGFSVAHHEEPIVQDGQPHYNVDLLKPKDQSCLFAVNSSERVRAGQPRFVLAPSIPWNDLGQYETVLGGVRPLIVDGKPLTLEPGAGNTGLHCSRTSIAWSADGSKFYILVVKSPDSELDGELRRRMNEPQLGGWDVSRVQEFWKNKQVANAILFDGGESTQLAYPSGKKNSYVLRSGYLYSLTFGHLEDRPLVVNFPILPPSEGHRGVLNYLYVDAVK